MKILLIEDEPDLRSTLLNFLEKEKFAVYPVENVFDAEDELLVYQFDLILLDITLPDGSGLDLLPIIRKSQDNAGVLIVSAKNSIDDKVNGLDLGADDYITKPFHLAELNSRIRALIRRKVYDNKEVLSFNEISIDTVGKSVQINDKPFELTSKEYSLLLYLITNKERILTKEDIADHLWGDSAGYFENYDFIYAHIKNLRKKIQAAGGNDYLKTVHGIGYKYTAE